MTILIEEFTTQDSSILDLLRLLEDNKETLLQFNPDDLRFAVYDAPCDNSRCITIYHKD